MPKVRIKASELIETQAEFVSLVSRGANRIPFRITKEDTDMFDLYEIGRRFLRKGDPKTQTPEIVGAVVAKGVDLKRVAAVFKGAGLNPQEFVKSEKDDVVIVTKQNAGKVQDTVVLKVSDEIGLVIANMKKAFDSYSYNSTDFNTVMATEGVYPSMCLAKEALGETIANILYKASSPAEAATKVAEAIDDFKAYMTTLLNAVPTQAFKADLAFSQVDVEKNCGGMLGGKKKSVKEEPEAGDVVEKADAGKNGTGAGFEAGKGTGTNPRATADDMANTAVNAVPGESVTGNPNEGPAEARKAQIAGLPDPKGHEPGDPDGFAAAPTDSDSATARATADDAANSTQNGGTKGSSIPDGDSGLSRIGGVRKNEGDADIGQKGKGNVLPDDQSGAGAQQPVDPNPVHKSDLSEVMEALATLQKSFESVVTEIKKEVGDLSSRVDQVAVVARKADEAINGTVFHETSGDVVRAVKADNDLPPLDTAYDRRAVA